MEAGRDRFRRICPTELADVGTCRKDPLATGDHNRARQIGGQLGRHYRQPGQHLLRQRVDLGIVEGDDSHPVISTLEQDQFSQISHA